MATMTYTFCRFLDGASPRRPTYPSLASSAIPPRRAGVTRAGPQGALDARPADGRPCVLPPSGALAAAPAERKASLRRVVELAPLDLGDDVGLARRPAAAAQHDYGTLDQPA